MDDHPSPRSAWRVHEGALRGLKVLDLSRILSGPFCTMVLADLGADVIKVEEPRRGDDTRMWGPPFQGQDASYFHSVNRNKRSLAVDLKSPVLLERVQRLACEADVVVENFRPGTAERLGLGYARISASNPGVVYASISGYGQTGPYRRSPGYDAIAQALSGMMSITGESGGDPVRFGVAGADLAAGMFTAIGVLSALHHRERTGQGQLVDVSLLDGQIAWLSYVAAGYFATDEIPRRYGSAHPTIAPYQALPTSDGYVMVAVGNDGLWRTFTQVTGLGELAEDPRYVTNPDRVRHREDLIGLLGKHFVTEPTSHWTQVLGEAGIPVAPINDVRQALEHPQVQAREMVQEVVHSEVGPLRQVASPIKLSGTPAQVREAPPVLGEHTADILGTLGMTEQQLRELADSGAIR
ncbi:CaiB/BaiF CoA transferase family protein [Streptomyces sp. NPDC003247]|uniref:CaiB/BaiF CoA transferase family protein n=1 Tax=Streptomyces sp. NPDC003247 TaxID=3364677 RepID=UPI00367EE7AD